MALRALQSTASGTGPVGGSGTIDTIPRWTAASTLGDSLLSQSGSIVTNSGTFRAANGTFSEPAYTFSASSGTGMYRATSGALLRFAVSGAYAFGVDTNGNFGIGTPSPVGRTDIAGTSVDQLAWGLISVRSSDAQGADKGGSLAFGGLYDATNSTHWAQISGRKENGTSGQYGGYLAFATRTNGAGVNTERARIDSAGRILQGTTQPPIPAGVRNTIAYAGSVYQGIFNTTANTGILLGVEGANGIAYTSSGPLGSEAYVIAYTFNTSGVALGTGTAMRFDASGSQQGLKLPATPGNADTQTLDAYRENTTWAPTVTWGTGGTVTTTSATGAYTQIGNVVTFTVTIAYNCSVIPTGGAITMDLPRTSASGFNQRPGSFAFNSWNGVAGTNFLSIGSASATATLRVANATSIADTATYLTVTASGALVVTATYIAS